MDSFTGELVKADTRGTFTFGERLGLSFIVIAACVSLAAILWLLTKLTFDLLVRWQRKTLRWPHPIFLLFYSMICSGLVHAIGSILHIRWVMLSGVLEGPYCTAQAVFRESGHPAVALASIGISIHTYRVIIQRKRPSENPIWTLAFIGVIWLYVLILMTVGLIITYTRDPPFFGNTVWYCSIRAPPYLVGSLAKYVCYWVAALISLAVYGRTAWQLHRQSRQEVLVDSLGRGSFKDSLEAAGKMMYYPLVYTICIVPHSITRFIQFSTGNPVAFEATAFSGILIALTGFFDVLLFTWTRPNMFPGTEDDASSMIEYDLPRNLELPRGSGSLNYSRTKQAAIEGNGLD